MKGMIVGIKRIKESIVIEIKLLEGGLVPVQIGKKVEIKEQEKEGGKEHGRI